MGLCALSNCCSVVNIFILTIRVGSELRGTSHSRSAELHDCAHAAARGISTFQSNFVTAQLGCPLWPLLCARDSGCSRSRAPTYVFDVRVSTSSPFDKLCDPPLNLDVSDFESSGLPFLRWDDFLMSVLQPRPSTIFYSFQSDLFTVAEYVAQ